MKNRFDLIIFDWDGTLVDSIDWIVRCIQDAAAEHGCPVPDAQAARDIIGLSLENAILTLFPRADSDTRGKLAAHYGQQFFSRQIGPDDLFPGVRDMLLQFKQRGFRLAVATGKKSAGLTKAMRATGVADVFCATRASDQTASKPDPLMVEEIMAELAVDRRRTLMVGDSTHDLQMALNARVASVAVTCGAHSADTLKQYRPLRCLAYPTELPSII
ncbi:HAD-IA family hydrolase [Methylomonas sp. SURF-2]|uniref:HAD-IA family hydrolase n=1 Tax=Methylomonas subterranea TaxID=2952225 RepID=A0ABT1TDS3_9GAMM|nr:HAD-IA family hydrolase [Methylomonas sp. SURF-2]MCQ8103616.1 HAD-IA family hydrolase [Methylomonas sp. SURF-2]